MENSMGISQISSALKKIGEKIIKTEYGNYAVMQMQRTTEENLPLRAINICSVSDAKLTRRDINFKDIHEL